MKRHPPCLRVLLGSAAAFGVATKGALCARKHTFFSDLLITHQRF